MYVVVSSFSVLDFILVLFLFWVVPTQAAVQRELAEAEALDLATGKDFTLDTDVSPSVLVSSGLDLEAEQCV